MSTDLLDSTFFTDRGIPDEIWQRRPYVRWTLDDQLPAKEHFAHLTTAQRAFVSKLTNQSDGWVIMRQPPPMEPPLPPILPELRPLKPVKTQGPRKHWHGDGTAPDDLMVWQSMPGNRNNWQAHIERSKNDDDHHGVNVETLHVHQAMAKYVFVSSPKMSGAYVHDHASSWTRTAKAGRSTKCQEHVVRHHDGIHVSGLHSHERRVKDPTAPAVAKRIDVHPMAVEGLFDAPVVFFVIEGCIKADAVLADGGAVFSVPSVSLWDADELENFVAEYLFDRTVVIVPDADWITKPMVINQARMCQTKLHRLGVPEIHVAAPPLTYDGKDTKGVDDFIGAGGHLEDLYVIDSDPPAGLHEYVASKSYRRDRARRDESVLWALSTYTGPQGIFAGPLQTLARVIGINKMSISRAIKDLENMGAITIDGDIAITRGWFTHTLDWTERPTITLIPELRSVDRPEQKLGDLIYLPLRRQKRMIANAA